MTNLFLSILGISLSVSLLVVLLLLLTPLLNRRYAVKWKYWIWICLALRLVIPLNGADIRSMVDKLPWTAPREEASIVQGDANLPIQAAVPSGRVIVEIPPQMTAPVNMSSEGSGLAFTPLDIAALLWFLGFAVFLSVHLTSYLRYKSQMMKKGTILTDVDVLCQIDALKRELHIRSAVYAMWYPEAGSPMMMGFFEPILVLPRERYSKEELFFILKHEMVHLKRRDICVKLLLVAANAVHWFNPLIWAMRREAGVDMELACDEEVTRGTDYVLRKAYTETLLSTLHRQCTRGMALSTQFYGGKQVMKKRFINILLRTGKKNGIAVLLCAVILIASLGTLVGCSAAKAKAEGAGQPEGELDASGSQMVSHNDSFEPIALDDQGQNAPGGSLDGDGTEGIPERAQNYPTPNSPADTDLSGVDIPSTGQIYGYITKYETDSAWIDRQLWITSESEDWKPEYDQEAGFEVVDAAGEDIQYPFHENCVYSVLENHQGDRIELDGQEFGAYLQEMEYPVLWVIELEDGQIKRIEEQYRP